MRYCRKDAKWKKDTGTRILKQTNIDSLVRTVCIIKDKRCSGGDKSPYLLFQLAASLPLTNVKKKRKRTRKKEESEKRERNTKNERHFLFFFFFTAVNLSIYLFLKCTLL